MPMGLSKNLNIFQINVGSATRLRGDGVWLECKGDKASVEWLRSEGGDRLRPVSAWTVAMETDALQGGPCIVTLAEASRETKNKNGRKNGGARGTTSWGSGKGGREQPTNVPEQTAQGTRQHDDSARRQISACKRGCAHLRPRLCSHILTSVNQRLTPKQCRNKIQTELS